jgi:hypothetical protein
MPKIHWIRTDGEFNVEEVDQAPAYDKVREFIANGKGQHSDVWLERVNVLHNDPEEGRQACAMYVDEEGNTHWKRLPVNHTASEHYHRFWMSKHGRRPANDIHGRAVLMVGVDFD